MRAAAPHCSPASELSLCPSHEIRLTWQGYHLLALALFAPALFLEPQLLAISLAIACALLVAVETVRVGQVPQMGPRIHSFMTSFIDDRDSGMLLVSPFLVC